MSSDKFLYRIIMLEIPTKSRISVEVPRNAVGLGPESVSTEPREHHKACLQPGNKTCKLSPTAASRDVIVRFKVVDDTDTVT